MLKVWGGKLNLKGSRIYRISAPGQKLNRMRYFPQIKSPTCYRTRKCYVIFQINTKEWFCLLDLKFLNLSASPSHLSRCHWFGGRGLKSGCAGRLKAASLGRIYKPSDGWKELNVSLWLSNLNISLEAGIKGRVTKQNAFSNY